MTMGVVAVALALPLFLDLFLQNARDATSGWNDAFDLSVYMDKKASDARVETLAKLLRQREDVASVRVITAEQALAEFRKDSGFGKALDALSDNPLPDTLIVTPTLAASTPGGTDALKLAITAMADVQTVQLDTEWVKRLHAILNILRKVVLLTAGLLGVGIVLIVGNTIRLDILNRRAEIEVMKLVGASMDSRAGPSSTAAYGMAWEAARWRWERWRWPGRALSPRRRTGQAVRQPVPVGRVALHHRYGRLAGGRPAWPGWAPGLLRRGISAASIPPNSIFFNSLKVM